MANFDVNEITRQANRLDEQIAVFSAKAWDIITSFGKIIEKVESEDSVLPSEMRSLMHTYQTLRVKITYNYGSLAKIMHSYALKSLKSDKEVTESIKSSKANIEKLMSELSSIPEIYTDFN